MIIVTAKLETDSKYRRKPCKIEIKMPQINIEIIQNVNNLANLNLHPEYYV